MFDHTVVIAGAGPTGLMLAGELALAGVDVIVVERRVDQHVDGSRAGGLLARTIEVLDQRGIADRFLDAGYTVPAQAYAGRMLDISDVPSRHNYVLALWQSRFEPILADWVGELGVPILRGREVVGLADDDAGVDVEVSGDLTLRAGYLVGCDGGRSTVRREAGIEVAGSDPTTSWLVAELEMDEEPEPGMRYDDIGAHGLGRLEDGGAVRVVLTERELRHGDPTMAELRRALVAVYGTDFGAHHPHWMSRFTDMTRQAVAYRRGRVLVAGDAAHTHPPHGGQGLNTGVQDAVNLGWKLARVVHGDAPERLLDTYHDERHPVGAQVLHTTMAQVALSRGGDRHQALRDTMSELLSMDEPRRYIGAMLAGLEIHYDFHDNRHDDLHDDRHDDLGAGHPLLGRRMPDLDLRTAVGPVRVFTLLHDARGVLLDLGTPGGLDIAPWADRVQLVEAGFDGSIELPVLGEVTAPTAVLIRPDGYVAWTAGAVRGPPDHPGSADPSLHAALEAWFGAPRPDLV